MSWVQRKLFKHDGTRVRVGYVTTFRTDCTGEYSLYAGETNEKAITEVVSGAQ